MVMDGGICQWIPGVAYENIPITNYKSGFNESKVKSQKILSFENFKVNLQKFLKVRETSHLTFIKLMELVADRYINILLNE